MAATQAASVPSTLGAGQPGRSGAEGVIGGVDTHADTIHVAAINDMGRDLGDKEFPTSPAGYVDALGFLATFGNVEIIGIEGSSSYGAGFARTAQAAGVEVREVNRPDRAERRRRGKSDPVDAYQAARAVLAGRAEAAVKHEDIEALRAVLNARRSAVKAATAAMNQIHSLLVTAPVAVREKYRTLTDARLVDALAASRPDTRTGTARAVLSALQMLARRHQFLTGQAQELQDQLKVLVAELNPTLLAAQGIGPNTAAQLLITAGGNPERLRYEASFAALCGAAPVQASSGKTHRHRLSRGGDRAANCALHTIALQRLQKDPRTQQWAQRQRGKGRDGLELLRLLKRALAREVRQHLLHPTTVPRPTDLRPLRNAKNISLATAAQALGTWPIRISEIEREIRHDGAFAQRYRDWLNSA